MEQNKAERKGIPEVPGRKKPRIPPAAPSPSPGRERLARFRALVKEAPEEPGVYLMRDEAGEIIYVGKAKVLRNRLSSYFSGRKDVKTRHLVARIEAIEWIIAASEYEALLLENTLIKRHAPKYNINLKDGKTYPSIRVTKEPFPRVFRTRRIVDDGSLYFGPFPSADIIDTYLDLIRRLFPLRRCANMRKRSEPCMYYHIGRCSAPCAGRISEADYGLYVEEVKKLLSGETEALLAELRGRMEGAALSLRFEEAAKLRDAVRAIEDFQGRTGAVDQDPEARDYVAWAADGELVTYVVFQMRGGKLTGRDLFRSRLYSSEEEALSAFLMSYYGPERLPPARVFAPSVAGLELVAAYFERELGSPAAFSAPGASPEERRHAAALGLAGQNALEDLRKRRRELGDPAALEELRLALGLSRTPERIEGFDIAHLHGKHTVASLVSFRNGVPDKKNYRHFKIKSLEGAIDDFASIREAVARRYTRLVNEEAELPDLVLVDGGAGQVSAAREILETLGLDCDLAGLAKREEEVYLPGRGEPVLLPRDSAALRVLVAVRDETHRFATGLNQRLRASELKLGVLEGAPGVGPERAKRLLRAFGSLELISQASAEDLASVGKMGRAAAAGLKALFLARDRQEAGPGKAPGELAAEPAPEYGAEEPLD